MTRNISKSTSSALFASLNGGLATRPNPLIIEAKSKEKMLSPSIKNCDLFATGSIAKRLGKTIQGNAVTGSVWSSQTTDNAEKTISAVASGQVLSIAQQFVAPSTKTIISLDVTIRAGAPTGAITSQAYIYTDVGSEPGVLVTNASSNILNINYLAGSRYAATFIFGNQPTLTSGVTYWIVVTWTIAPNTVSWSGDLGIQAAGTGIKTNTNFGGGGSWTSVSGGIFYRLWNSNSPINGLYDFRAGSNSTQAIMASVGGTLYYHARNATPLTGAWTSLTTGLGSGQNILYSFATLKDYLFSADYATNPIRVWDGTQTYTTQLGFRATGTFTRSATGGSLADGTYKILLVTTLISGGYRSSIEYSVTATGGGTDKIVVSNLNTNGSGATDFGFDVGTTCTYLFMTLKNGSLYYLLPSASMASVSNPVPNASAAGFNITACPAGTENTLLDQFSLDQGYFTSQVATPTCAYLATFNGMIAMSGSSANPSRVWFSEYNAPQVWSTQGGLQGNFQDLNTQDGEIIIGLKEWNGDLYVFKRHSVFVIRFTGNSNAPFVLRKLAGNIGALSHWSIKEITNQGLVFISERGPAICTGTTVKLLPAASKILDRFDPNNANRYNLASMLYTTAGNNSNKMQIHWGVSSTNATTRDITLVYDYENGAFWENDVSANYYSEVTDANFFPSVWSGDYSAQVFQHDSGTNDNGSAINWYFQTPNVQLGRPFEWKQIDQIQIAGAVQSSGTLSVDVYLDFSTTSTATYSFDMTDARFKSGLSAPVGFKCKSIAFKLSNSALDVPVQIDAIGIDYQVLGTSL